MKPKSPYLAQENRLADVIAAIQAMGSYKKYKLPFSEWADRIAGDELKAGYWQRVFTEHPEFFRLDGKREQASLVWRRQFRKRFHTETEKIITRDEFYAMDDEGKAKVSRNPLSPEDIAVLINTAIELHARELQHQQDKRWLITLVVSGIGGLVGAIIGGLLKS